MPFFLRQIFPVSGHGEKDFFPLKYKTDVRTETELAVFVESFADAQTLPVRYSVMP